MKLGFKTEELCALCNTRVLLAERFGEFSPIVERRLLTLALASKLGEVTVSAPDRRRIEPTLDPRAVSVCAREAGRIYFYAGAPNDRSRPNFEEVDYVEIFAIGREIR